MRWNAQCNVRALTSKYILASIAGMFALMVSACSGPAPAGPVVPPAEGRPGAGLVPRQTSIDLGRVPFDIIAEGQFELTNTDIRPVRLLGSPDVRMLEGC